MCSIVIFSFWHLSFLFYRMKSWVLLAYWWKLLHIKLHLVWRLSSSWCRPLTTSNLCICHCLREISNIWNIEVIRLQRCRVRRPNVWHYLPIRINIVRVHCNAVDCLLKSSSRFPCFVKVLNISKVFRIFFHMIIIGNLLAILRSWNFSSAISISIFRILVLYKLPNNIVLVTVRPTRNRWYRRGRLIVVTIVILVIFVHVLSYIWILTVL